MQDVRELEGTPTLLVDRGRDLVVATQHVAGRPLHSFTMRWADWSRLPAWRGAHPFGAGPRPLLRGRAARAADQAAWEWLLPHRALPVGA